MGAALLLFWKLANPPIPPVPLGESVFIRDIYILIDSSDSMVPKANGKTAPEDIANDFEAAKGIIREKIFPHLGPGDRVFCYKIGTDFLETSNRVFGQKALPGVPENLLDPKLAVRIPDPEKGALWQQVNEVIGNDWNKRLDQLSAQDRGESHYLDALSYIATRTKTPSNQRLREKRVIVIGDMEEYPKPIPHTPPEPKDDEVDAFKGVKVRAIYPYRSKKGNPVRPEELRKFWQKYFAQRGSDGMMLTTFDDPEPLISHSPAPTVTSQSNR